MKADYGIDAPTVVRNMLIGAALLAAASAFHPVRWLIWPAISLGATALVMILGSKVIKLKARDKILNSLQLSGSEQVLDIGCGRGLMLIGAAKRLTTGSATGLDLWRRIDQSGNSPETTLANAKAEGVENRIRLETGDATNMPFSDNTFDVVLSSWALHNIPTTEGRQAAVTEAHRVLRPGGKLTIVDLSTAKEYAARLKQLGCDVQTEGPNFLFVMPSFTIRATKPQ